MSPEHAEHYRLWREMIEAHVGEFGSGEGDDGSPETEARLAADMDRVEAFANTILATPARTWGDVLLYAEVLFWALWLGCDPEGPDAPRLMQEGPHGSESDLIDLSVAKLLEAIFSLTLGLRIRACLMECAEPARPAARATPFAQVAQAIVKAPSERR